MIIDLLQASAIVAVASMVGWVPALDRALTRRRARR